MFGRFSYGADLAKVVALVGLSLFSSAFACTPARADFFSDLFGGGRGDGRVYGSAIPRETVPYNGPEKPGTIIVATSERRLYYVLGDGQALKYGVGVGRSGFEWSGAHHVSGKREWPDWTPPAQMIERRPELPRHMEGGIENPLGARAIYIGSTLYRIHGSNEPETIGHAVSSGCIRMTNSDVIDLYERVKIGARVVVQR